MATNQDQDAFMQAYQRGSNSVQKSWGGGGQQQGFQQQMQGWQQQRQRMRGSENKLQPGGLDAQLGSINSYYDMVRNAKTSVPSFSMGGVQPKEMNIGFDPQAYQASQLGGRGQERGVGERSQGYSSDLNSLARRLAESYGLDIGRGQLVDESGNLMITPDQIQASSGGAETLGSAAAKLNYLSAAVTKEMNNQQQQKGIAAIQAGMGQIQKRGRGSLAAMQSGMYQDLADLYSNQEFEAADYSYFIQKEQMDLASELDRRARDVAKKRSRGQFWGGAAMTIGGLWTGNYGVAAQGFGMASTAYGDTGYDEKWF